MSMDMEGFEPDEVLDEDADTTMVFTVEVMSARGDTWVWSDVAVDETMDIHELLGEPSAFYRLGEGRD